MVPGPGRRGRPTRTPVETSDQHPEVARNLRTALRGYLRGRRLAQIQFRQVEGKRIEGFLTIEDGESGNMVDFRAIATHHGEIFSLEVGGRNIAITSSVAPRKLLSHRSRR